MSTADSAASRGVREAPPVEPSLGDSLQALSRTYMDETDRTTRSFKPGERVRIIDRPTSISRTRAGARGVLLGACPFSRDLVDVALDSGHPMVPARQVMLHPDDLEADQ